MVHSVITILFEIIAQGLFNHFFKVFDFVMILIIWNELPRKIVEIREGLIQWNSSNTNIVQNGTYKQNYKRLGVFHNELNKAFCLQDYFLRKVKLCIYMNEYMRRHKSLLCRLGELTLLCIYKIKRNKGFIQASRTSYAIYVLIFRYKSYSCKMWLKYGTSK